MSFNNLTDDFERYRLTVSTHGESTLQLITDNNGINTWQAWMRKRSLGQGAYGQVWQEVWEDQHGDSHYRAVKTCSEAKMRANGIDYKRELSALAAFSRSEFASWFVNLHGWWMDSGNLCVAMECLGRGDLSKYATSGIPEPDIKEIAENILQGLAVMHAKGFTHRDIKPQNILVVQKRPEFHRWWVKIADFGISKQTSIESETALHTSIGTRPYCAPEILGYLEQVQETSVYSSKVDMWSFGCVLFNLGSRGHLAFSEIDLTRYCDGRVQFNPKNLPIHLSNAGVSLIKALLNVDPKQRPDAAKTMQDPWFTTQSITMTESHLQLPSQPPQSEYQKNFNSFLDSTLSVNPSLHSTMTRLTDHPTSNRVTTEPSSTGQQLPSLPGHGSDEAPNMPHTRATGFGNKKVIAASPQMLPTKRSTSRANTVGDSGYKKLGSSSSSKVPSLDTAQEDVRIMSQALQSSLDEWLRKNHKELEECSSRGKAPIHLAAQLGKLEIIEQLMLQGADIHAKDKDDWTPLHWTACYGHLEVVKWLVENGANIHAKSENDWTPLHLAIRYGHLEVVKCLVEHGADIDAKNKNDSTPLHWAAYTGRLEVLKCLVEHGADIDAKNKNDQTPLHFAAYDGHLEVLKCLVEHGADINAKDKDHSTPLYWAAENGHLEMVKWLAEHGADIHGKNKNNWTSLHFAAGNGHLEVVKWLVKQSVNIHAKDRNGVTPKSVAARRYKTEVARWLNEQASPNRDRLCRGLNDSQILNPRAKRSALKLEVLRESNR